MAFNGHFIYLRDQLEGDEIMSTTGSKPGFRIWVPIISTCQIMGIQISKGGHNILVFQP